MAEKQTVLAPSGIEAGPGPVSLNTHDLGGALLDIFRLHVDGLTLGELSRLMLVHYRLSLSEAKVKALIADLNRNHVKALDLQGRTPYYLVISRLFGGVRRYLLYEYVEAAEWV